MKRQSIIIVTHEIKDPEAWGNLKEACGVHGWSYWTLVKKPFPIYMDGHTIHKTPFKQKADD